MSNEVVFRVTQSWACEMSRIIPIMMLFCCAIGCHLQPELGPPGTIGNQRSRAVLNDPFPSDELGPEIKGARPRGFDLPEPRAEGLQKYSPRQNFTPANTPIQIAPQAIVPTRTFPTQANPTQVVPTQPFPIQPAPVQPGYSSGY